MSVRAKYLVSPFSSVSLMSPMAIPATEARSGTPALSRAKVEAHTEPIEVEPLEPMASET